jgi:hypothetical protein
MFPGMSPVGGTLDNVPALVSDAASPGSVTLFDASQVAVSAGLIELDRSDAATLNLDSVPDSPLALDCRGADRRLYWRRLEPELKNMEARDAKMLEEVLAEVIARFRRAEVEPLRARLSGLRE